LRGQPVSMGLNGSATQLVARSIFQSLGVEVREVPLEFNNAVDAVSLGNVAAIVILAAKPFEGLKGLPTGIGLHLVSIPQNASAGKRLAFGVLAPIEYPDLLKDGSISTVTADAVLVAKTRARANDLKRAFSSLFAGSAPLLHSQRPELPSRTILPASSK